MPKSAVSIEEAVMSDLQWVSCEQIMPALVLFIDHELPTESEYQVFEFHFQNCPPCLQTMEHERTAIEFMQNLLRNTCTEQAPEGLNERILQQTQILAGQTQVEFFSQTTITEFSFDGTTSIQVTQEFTQEIRHDFN